MQLKVPRTRSRAHKILFDKDLPFRPKREKRQDGYQRRLKNQRHSQMIGNE